MTISLLAACSANDDVTPEVPSVPATRVVGITVVNETTGIADTFKYNYDESGRLFFTQYYIGQDLYEDHTLHFNSGSIVIENKRYTSNDISFTEYEMKDGFAVKRTIGGVTDILTYSDGFLVSDSRLNRVYTWKNGDLANYYWNGSTSFGAVYRIKATYSWTKHENIYANDELDPSFVFGGHEYCELRYFGKRSAHLPAKVEYDYSEVLPLFLALSDQGGGRGSTLKKTFEYSYTFDDAGRVSKVKIIMKTRHFIVSFPEKSVDYTDGESASTVYIQYAQ